MPHEQTNDHEQRDNGEADPAQKMHGAIVEAGATAAVGAKAKLDHLRVQRGDDLTVAIVRRELRAWLRTTDEGRAVESAVRRLLAGDS